MLKKLFIKNTNIIFKFMICIGIIFFFPVIVSLIYKGEEYQYIWPFLGISLGLLLISIPIVLITNVKSKKIFLSSSNSSILVFVIWIILILLSTIPFSVYNDLNYLYSLREATSAWTTTGITFFNFDHYSFTLIFWRSWMQFLGGLGIIFIAILFVSTKNSSSLFVSEGHSLKIFSSIKKTVSIIFLVYLSYLVFGTIAYIIAGMNVFDAIIHCMSALSSGGFSSKKEGISFFNSPAINVITCVIMIVGTINFPAQVILFSGKFKKFLSLTEIIWTAIFLLFALLFVLIYSFQLSGNYMANVGNAYFNVISAITTTGYVSDPNFVGDTIYPSYLFLILIFMIIGNNSNSTSGGLKTYRMAIWFKEIFRASKRIFFKSSLIKLRCYNTPSGKVFLDNIREISYYLSLYLLFMFVGVLILTASGVMSVEHSFLNLIDCFSNTGMGLTSCCDSHPLIIVIDCIAMLIGRLELTFILLIITSFTKIFQKNNNNQLV